eukprot:jgi/Tetstr1/439276/TSEL_027718.t1
MAPEDLSGRDNSPDADLRKELISEAATLLTKHQMFPPHAPPPHWDRGLGRGQPAAPHHTHSLTGPPRDSPPRDDHMTDNHPPSGEDYSDLEEEDEDDELGRVSMYDDDWL